VDDKMIWGIRIMRALSACIEVGAVILLFRMKEVESMIRVNGLLGLVGPLIFITVSALGLAAGLGKIAPQKLLFIFTGVVLVVWGSRAS
jgi:hypothetical protein